MSLQGKVAIVTGGSRGIGAGIAKALAKRGAKVLITYASSKSLAEAVVSSIESSGGTASATKADCMSVDTPKIVIEEAIKFNGGIDIIINNAGAGDEMWLKDVTYEHFDKIFHTNVRFPMFLMKESLPYIRKGRVVNIGSVVARQGECRLEDAHSLWRFEGMPGKLFKTWAVELGHEYGITVNTVNPGPVATDMWT